MPAAPVLRPPIAVGSRFAVLLLPALLVSLFCFAHDRVLWRATFELFGGYGSCSFGFAGIMVPCETRQGTLFMLAGLIAAAVTACVSGRVYTGRADAAEVAAALAGPLVALIPVLPYVSWAHFLEILSGGANSYFVMSFLPRLAPYFLAPALCALGFWVVLRALRVSNNSAQ